MESESNEVEKMTNFYDVTFHETNGKAVIKKQVLSKREPFEAWQDACEAISEKQLNIRVNEDSYIILNRDHIVRIDVKQVDGPVEEHLKHQDELVNVINTLSNMGI